jgi:N6-L-threonylcarbamoyladenine synthase
MIAMTAWYKYQAGEFVGLDAVPGARAGFEH